MRLLHVARAALFSKRKLASMISHQKSRLLLTFTFLLVLLAVVFNRDFFAKHRPAKASNEYIEINAYKTLYKGVYSSDDFIQGHEQINHFKLLVLVYNNRTSPPAMLSQEKLDRADRDALLNFLYANQAFLADVSILNESTVSTVRFDLTKKLNEHRTQSSKSTFLSFGVLYVSINKVKELEARFFNSSLSRKCDLRQSLVRNVNLAENAEILAGWYFVCANLVVHVALFYKRGDFLWVSSDEYFLNGEQKVFGDKPRSLSKYYKIFFYQS
jgi:hypothetical protein